ncbi:hypothetical protein IE81DRAFT_90528 [Ceraceosorus guamensis]|uniref:Uncharacterized protein n=1 Tax=Ceraceosorus guamensis TaxID=1522189 RepID=A0A316W0P3_9BASI|nr:hypothetical protein IE81DRAFT_90528 [Ceraceosorus guamensis]PWN43416.1 hypothetical protein IE81DRAFT_90528 [Ceraceosorus guamensis]
MSTRRETRVPSDACAGWCADLGSLCGGRGRSSRALQATRPIKVKSSHEAAASCSFMIARQIDRTLIACAITFATLPPSSSIQQLYSVDANSHMHYAAAADVVVNLDSVAQVAKEWPDAGQAHQWLLSDLLCRGERGSG